MSRRTNEVRDGRWSRALSWLAAGVGATGLVIVGVVPSSASSEAGTQPTVETRTIYVKGHKGKAIAEEANRAHESSTHTGWVFADMEIQIENGDVEGAWITYTRRR